MQKAAADCSSGAGGEVMRRRAGKDWGKLIY